MKIDSKVQGDITILTPSADTGGITCIDIDNFSELEEQVDDTLRDGCKKLVLDFKNIDYIDSSGLGLMLEIYKAVTEKDGQLSLSNVVEKVLKVFKVIKLDKKMSIQSTLEDATSSFS
jgi:stage II sporulation protein AA (anti-sigma F factor antagonist)